jgi:hypothetical protein
MFWSNVAYYGSLERTHQRVAARQVILTLDVAMRPYLNDRVRPHEPFLDWYDPRRFATEIRHAHEIWSNPLHQDTHVFEWIDAAAASAERRDRKSALKDLRAASVCDDFGEVHLLIGDILSSSADRSAHREWLAALENRDLMAGDAATPNDWQYSAMRRLAREARKEAGQ